MTNKGIHLADLKFQWRQIQLMHNNCSIFFRHTKCLHIKFLQHIKHHCNWLDFEEQFQKHKQPPHNFTLFIAHFVKLDTVLTPQQAISMPSSPWLRQSFKYWLTEYSYYSIFSWYHTWLTPLYQWIIKCLQLPLQTASSLAIQNGKALWLEWYRCGHFRVNLKFWIQHV